MVQLKYGHLIFHKVKENLRNIVLTFINKEVEFNKTVVLEYFKPDTDGAHYIKRAQWPT